MENIEDEIKKARFVKKLQAAWSVTNNIIGYSLIVAVIILGVKHGYCGCTHFAVFCWAAGIYFFSKYIYYPLFTNRKYHPMTAYKQFFCHIGYNLHKYMKINLLQRFHHSKCPPCPKTILKWHYVLEV